MKLQSTVQRLMPVLAATALALVSAAAFSKEVKVELTGAQETPPVSTSAKGSGAFHIGHDKSVSGSVKTTGIEGTAAHIHTGAVGQSGPPIITLTKGTDGTWTVPAGSKLTDEQYKQFKDGDLYVNVHSAE